MPTSSSAGRQTRPGANSSNKRSYWLNTNSNGNNNNNSNNDNSSNAGPEQHQSRFTSFQQKRLANNKVTLSSSLSSSKSSLQQQQQQQKYSHQHHHQSIRHISPPSSLASTSFALRNTMAERAINEAAKDARALHSSQADAASVNHHHHHHHHHQQKQEALSLAGHMVVTGPTGLGKQPNSLSSITSLQIGGSSVAATQQQQPNSSTTTGGGGVKSFLVSNSQYARSVSKHSQSQMSLQQPSTTASSTAQLHSLTNLSRPATPLSMRRTVNLKYVKTLIILLMAVDLLITVFVHQFSTQDYLSLWFTSYKLRFSLLNLILSSAWFIILIGAILFDVYFILLISCLIHVASFALLLVFSVIHFTRRIDYNTVNLTSLLALLFSIIMLQLYLVVMAALTIYLTIAVKRRRKTTLTSSSTTRCR